MILSNILYGFETWTLNETLEKTINSFESKSYRRILHASYTEQGKRNIMFSKQLLKQ